MQPSYYNSIWVTGCAPGGTGEVRLVEQDNESNVIARATIVVVQYTVPSHIRNLRQTEEGDGSLTVTWDAPRRTGGSDDRGLRGAASAGWCGLGQRIPTGARHLRDGDQPHGHGAEERHEVPHPGHAL